MKNYIAAFILGIIIPVIMAASYGSIFLSTSIDSLTATLSNQVQLVAPISTWSEQALASAAAATVTHAAGGAGVRHVTTSVTGCIINGGGTAAAPALELRDGATGAGTIVWQAVLAINATTGDTNCVTISGLAIIGSDNTAMTLEFNSSPGTSNQVTVSLTGYSVE